MTESRAGAPASSANLGPGFDTIALALDLHCRVTAEPADEWSVTHLGPHIYSGGADEDAILRAARFVSTRPLRLTVQNDIPLSRGLGSSAAAFTAGSLAAMRANDRDPDHDELFGVVQELEGHPDNAAAAVYGGLVAVANGSVIPLGLADTLVPVLAVPGFELRTTDARRVLPETYEVDVVSRTLGRFAALIEGLRTGCPALLALAAGDELHEAPRQGLNPMVPRLIALARTAGALHACWSGAGPSVLSLTTGESESRLVEALEAEIGEGGMVLVLSPNTAGAV